MRRSPASPRARRRLPAFALSSLAALLVLGGCAPSYSVRHTVAAGESVAVLARRSGVSEEEIRRLNRLGPADGVKPGDVVLLPESAQLEKPRAAPPPAVPPPRREKAAPPAETRRPPPEAPAAAAPREAPKAPPPERTPAAPPPAASKAPAAAPAPAPAPAAPAPVAKARPPAPTPTPRERKDALRWPVEGEVVRHFGKGASGENLGIDIGAPAGTAVRAAAGGRVIYARAPTQAYGPLVIVDHGGRLHTVYASLKELSVKRGDSVEQGHTIGTVGESTLTPPPHLHFEVRRNGDAVDPLSFLPAR